MTNTARTNRPREILEGLFNDFFELTHRAAGRRFALLLTAFVAAGLLFGFIYNHDNFVQALRGLFSNIFALGGDFQGSLLSLFEASFGSVAVWRSLLMMIAAFVIAYLIAGLYPADIFEKENSVGRRFLRQAAFGIGYNRISISEGKVSARDEESPILLIGGPGRLLIHLDSAVLVEGPLGTRVFGPTAHERGAEAILHGHERIRQIFDLRDKDATTSVFTRSRDGIPVIARDVRFVYSILRDDTQVPTHDRPYPFNEKGARNQVYKFSRPANRPLSQADMLAQPLPRPPFIPVSNQISMFVSASPIGEFLANIGDPELDASKNREERITQTSGSLVGGFGTTSGIPMIDRGNFRQRREITERYLGENFKRLELDRGFSIRWIGVGTWEVPYEDIWKNHVQAWKMSRDNASRGNPQKLQELQTESTMQELLRLLQEVLAVYRRNRRESASPSQVFSALGSLYFEYLVRVLEMCQRDYQQNADTPDKEQLDKYLPPNFLLHSISAMAGRYRISHLNRNFLVDYYNFLLNEFETRYRATGEPATPRFLETLWELSRILDE